MNLPKAPRPPILGEQEIPKPPELGVGSLGNLILGNRLREIVQGTPASCLTALNSLARGPLFTELADSKAFLENIASRSGR